MDNKLKISGGDHAIQAMPLVKGGVNLVPTATVSTPLLAHCVVDGTLTITWDDDTTDDIACVEGDDFSFIGTKSIEVISGTFHII